MLPKTASYVPVPYIEVVENSYITTFQNILNSSSLNANIELEGSLLAWCVFKRPLNEMVQVSSKITAGYGRD